MEFPKNEPVSAGQQKVDEYVDRIRNGADKDNVLQGLPQSFVAGIEKRLSENAARSKTDEQTTRAVEIPQQYLGLDADTLDFIWTIPEYVDPEKTRELKERKASALAFLRGRESLQAERDKRSESDRERIQEIREQLGVARPEELRTVTVETSPQTERPMLDIEERKKLRGWEASYELAKIAMQNGIDLSAISREDYVSYAIQNSLVIDDTQLRAAPWQRMGTSAQEIVQKNKEKTLEISEESEKAFSKFCYETKKKAAGENRVISENVRVRQGTKDSDSWLFFGINEGVEDESEETYKAYISVKDLNTLTPERFTAFMVALRDARYNGDIKIFQDLSEQGIRLNDQVVMHGKSQADAELALRVAEDFFRNDLNQKSLGKDAIVDGKRQSYSQILAGRIKEAVLNDGSS